MFKILTIVTAIVAGLLLRAAPASAHCDALDGPVVSAARVALDKNDVTLVLRWVPAEHETEVRSTFDRAVAVGRAGGEAKALAETWFFETLVRIHRAGEGASFDGLKPAGHIEPFVAAVDRSLAEGKPDDVIASVSAHVTRGLHERFARARETQAQAGHAVEPGRAYVAAYVDYLHYVEALLRAGSTPDAAHQKAPADGHTHDR